MPRSPHGGAQGPHSLLPWAAAMGFCAYVAGLAALAPAALLNSALQNASHGRLHLTDTRGTLWTGGGQLEVRDGVGRSGIARRLDWKLLPASLLRGKLAYEITMEKSAVPFPISISRSRIDIANASVEFPGSVLGLAAPKLAPLGLSGDVVVKAAALSIGREDMQGEFTVQWHAAGSALAPVSPFGDYTLQVTGDGAGLRAEVRTVQGPLQITGSGPVAKDGSFGFPVLLSVADNYFAQFAPLLRMISVERRDGVFEFKFT